MSGGRLESDVQGLDPAAVRALRDLLDGDAEALAELVDAFLAEAPERLAELRQGADRGDDALARRAAHTLKSNALTFGAGGFASRCRELEQAAAEHRLADSRRLVDDLEGRWPGVREQLLALHDRGWP